MKYDTITRASIQHLIGQFYAAVRVDEILGPVFTGVIGDDWDAHIETLVEFWSTIALGTRSFHGNVYGKHMQLMGITPAHFQRWLALFENTADRLFEQACVDELMTLARRVAASLQLGFFGNVAVQ